MDNTLENTGVEPIAVIYLTINDAHTMNLRTSVMTLTQRVKHSGVDWLVTTFAFH